MPLRDELPAGLGRGEVGRRSIPARAQPREDVRGHVEGVRRGRGDLRVGARRRQRLGGERRVVEGVDHVVRDAGMLAARAGRRPFRMPAAFFWLAKVVSLGGAVPRSERA